MKVDYYRPKYVNHQIDEVNATMRQNINLMLKRGESLDQLVACSAELSSNAKVFRSAKKMGRPRLSFRGRSSLSSKEIAEENYPTTTDTVNVLSTTTEAGMSSSSFAIPRRSTIDADVSFRSSLPRFIFTMGILFFHPG